MNQLDKNIGSAILGKSDGINDSGTLFTLICKPNFIGKALFAISDVTLMNSELIEMPCDVDSFEIEIYELSHDPILSVDPGSIDFGTVQFAKMPTKTFKVFNSGEGEISGTLDSYTPWLKVSPKKFTGETEITITADTTLLPPNQSYKGNIGIQSNGGQIEIPVSISIRARPSKSLELAANLFSVILHPVLDVLAAVFHFAKVAIDVVHQ